MLNTSSKPESNRRPSHYECHTKGNNGIQRFKTRIFYTTISGKIPRIFENINQKMIKQ